MPKANPNHTRIPSRRDVMRGGGTVAAAAVIGVAVAAMPAAAGDDALILQLEQEYRRLYAKLRDPGFPDDRVGALGDEIGEIEERIAALPASTFAGLAVKLRIAADNLPPECEWCGDHLNLHAALRDAERMAGVRA